MFTGFNILSFDFPVLHRRAMIEDIGVAPLMAQNLMRRQEYNRHSLDLMQLLGRLNPFSGRNDTINNLDYYLARYGLGEKSAHGSDVWPMFQAGKHQEILDYCVDDVNCEAALFERVAPWIVVPRNESIEKPAIGEKGRI
jgi:predicted PolB exonuclease-like 3'-5' exonuclease